MRVPALVLPVLLATSLLCHADDRTASSQVTTLSGSSQVSPSDFASARMQPETSVVTFPGRKHIFSEDDTVCYTMRTYVMVREDRHSDMTRRDGYRRCQPAWKFEVRSAIQPLQDRP